MEQQLNIWSERLPAWLWNILIISAVLLTGFIVKLILTVLLKFYSKSGEYSILKSVLTRMSRPFNHFVPLLVLTLTIPFLSLRAVYEIKLEKLVSMLLIISFAHVLVSSIGILEDFVYHQYDLKKSDNLRERKIRTQLQFLRRLAVVVIVLVSLSIILLSFDNVRKLGTGLLTGVGIGGIIIGFAAQKSLGNLLAGFQLAFTQPIRIDDVLVVEGEWGRVEEITLTYVVLNIWDQRRLILPINYFIEKPFQNWTRSTAEILGTVFLYVDHTVPVDKLRLELTRLLEGSALWDHRVGLLQVTEVKEKTIELRALMSAQDSSKAFDLRCYIREQLIAFIRDNYPESLPKQRYLASEMSN